MSIAPVASAHLPTLVLAAYVEPVVRGRRVAVLGDATTGLAEALASRGARLVHAYDPDPGRTAEALAKRGPTRPQGVTFALLEGDLGVRDGAFDAVIVPDLSAFSDPSEILRRARRLVGASGVAIVASPNAASKRPLVRSPRGASAPSYYELYDLVTLQFPRVRMLGQAPFVGYTVADFAPDGEPTVSVDQSLTPSPEEPEHFLAVASERDLALEEFAVVQLPWSEIEGGEVEATTTREETRLQLAEAQARLTLIGAELEGAREKLMLAERRAADGAQLAARVAELELELEAVRARTKELEQRAGDSHVRAERLTHQIRDLEEELVRQRDRGTKLTKQVDDEKRLRQKAELELGMVRNKPEIAGAKDRIDALTQELHEARSRIAELELESAETLRRGAAPRAPDPALEEARARVEQLDHQLARRSAERDEARTRSAELEARLAALEVKLAESEGVAVEHARRATAAELRAVENERKVANAIEAANIEADVSALETRLVERGHAVAKLTADLRESERIGRELVAEVVALRDELAPSGGSGGGGGGGRDGEVATRDELRAQLDTLAATAARYEADLQAASWKIAELERKSRAPAHVEPSAQQRELELALAAAQAELADLRKSAPTASV